MPDAAKASAARADLRFQYWRHPVARGQIRIPHDPGRDPRLAISPAIAHGGNTGDEFGLPHRPHLRRSRCAIHRVALQEHAADDVVAGGAIGKELMQQVAIFRHLPRFAARASARRCQRW